MQFHDLFRNRVYDSVYTVGHFLLFNTALPPSNYYSYLLRLATNYIHSPRLPLQRSIFHNSGLFKNAFSVLVRLTVEMSHLLNKCRMFETMFRNENAGVTEFLKY
jgi:hypothetical protein